MQPLKPINLNRQIALSDLPFTTTADLIETIRLSPSAANSTAENPTGTSLLKSGSLENHAWVAQAEAKSAALFGLKMKQAGFNILVLGDHGCGRTSLMQDAMAQVAKAADSLGIKLSTPIVGETITIDENLKTTILTLRTIKQKSDCGTTTLKGLNIQGFSFVVL